MSDIERLENELRQSKHMLLTLSSQISSMEAELEKIRAGQLQAESQNQMQTQAQANMQAEAQFQNQTTTQNLMQEQSTEQKFHQSQQMSQQTAQAQATSSKKEKAPMEWEQRYGKNRDSFSGTQATSPYRNPANYQAGTPAGHPANMQPGAAAGYSANMQPGVAAGHPANKQPINPDALYPYNPPGMSDVPPSYNPPVNPDAPYPYSQPGAFDGNLANMQPGVPAGYPANMQPGAPAGYPANMQPGALAGNPANMQSGRPNSNLSYQQPGTSTWSSDETPAEPLQKKFNPEELLGKNIMGIAASVLIFISFILFAVLMVPLLTDNIKVILMLTVSLGITAFGLVMWFRKERKSTFFLSLSACGVGAVYISLFMCNAYFHIINDLVLYLLILIWAAGVLVLSRYKQRLFEVIGEVGILVSIIFGCAMCAERSDGTMIMVLTIYSIIGITAFLGLRIQDEKSLIIHGVFALISAMSLSIADNTLIQNESGSLYVSVSLVLVIAFCIGIMVLYTARLNDSNTTYMPVFSILANIILFGCLYLLISNDTAAWITILITTIAIYCGLEFIKQTWAEKITSDTFPIMMEIWQILELIAATVCIFNVHALKVNVGVGLLAIPLIIYGFIKEERISLIKGLAAFGILTLSITLELASYIILPLACFIMISVFMMIKRSLYSEAIKGVSYVLFMIYIPICVAYLMSEYIWYHEYTMIALLLIMGIINLVAKLSPYGKCWLTHEEETSFMIISNIVNALLMIYSLYLITEANHEVVHFLASLAGVGLFCINSLNLLKKEDSMRPVYVGIKFTVLVMVILSSYDAANYILSISAFVLAIAFIVMGFLMDIKSLRIYGLVVSMICTLKLVMVDITYENTAGHALSFFISGVLCFVISAVYSMAEKKLQNKE